MNAKNLYRRMKMILLSVVGAILLATSLGDIQSVNGLGTFSARAASQGNTYYVSPGQSIQTVCLDKVQPGDTCIIQAGTYNESLLLKTSGTATGVITIRGEGTVIVNSGNAQTIKTSATHQSYYTFDHVRFISTMSASEGVGTLDFTAGWSFSYDAPNTGNGYITLKNCYVEGGVHFYGANNSVENCEFNGMNRVRDGIHFNRPASHNGIIRNNLVYNYANGSGRGIWVQGGAHDIVIEGNTVHDVKNGIDCDGAGVPVHGCNVINNHVYNAGLNLWGPGLFFENCFDCLVQGNTIHDIQNGAAVYVINYGNGSNGGWHTRDNIEYRDDPSNMVFRENLIYNYPTNPGLLVISVNGITIDHNTFYEPSRPSIRFRIEQDDAGTTFPPKNETITNNIYKTVTWDGATTGLRSSRNFSGDPRFINPAAGDFHLQTNSSACGAGTFPCSISDNPLPTSTVTPIATLTVAPTTVIPSSSLPGLSWEAEQGQITAPFAAENGTVSQKVSTLDPADGGQALYRFIVQDAGDYIVKAVVSAPDDGSNSFFVGMDTEPTTAMIWDIPLTKAFEEQEVTWRGKTGDVVFNLSAGNHTLIFLGRESRTSLDKIEIAKVPVFQPTTTAIPGATVTQEPTQTPISIFTPTAVDTATSPPSPTPEPLTVAPTESPAPELQTPTETLVPPTVTLTEPPVSIPSTPAATTEVLPTENPTKPPVSETIYDDKDKALVYSSGWQDSHKGTAYKGSFKETSKNGASVTLDFTGQSFSVLYKSGRMYRNLDVYVDGVKIGTINENSRTQAFQQRWDYDGQLSPGTHTLKLVFVAQGNRTRGSLDAIIIE